MTLPGNISALDAIAAAVFLFCWFGFIMLANFVNDRRPSLISAMRHFRRQWIERMSERDNHIGDAALLSNLLRGALFFASHHRVHSRRSRGPSGYGAQSCRGDLANCPTPAPPINVSPR